MVDDRGRRRSPGPKHSGPVRRRRAGRAARAPARARLAARRARRRRGRRSAARGVDGRVLQRRRVPRAGRGPARAAADRHRRARLARLVGPGDHGHRASTCRRSTTRVNAVSPHARAKHQPARAPGAGRRRGAGGARPPPRGAAAVRDRARGARRRRPATASPPTRPARPTTRRARRWRPPGAATPVIAAGGGSIPLVSALQAAVPEAEILLVGTTDGYANIHAPERARAARRVREGGRSPRPSSSATTRRAGATE